MMIAEPVVSITNSQGHTELLTYSAFVDILAKPMPTDIEDKLHAAVGIAGEAGELIDRIKKSWIYNKPEDRDNVVEELGDLRFYMQLMMNKYNITEEEVLQSNVNKVSIRYSGMKYSDEAAQARADKMDGE